MSDRGGFGRQHFHQRIDSLQRAVVAIGHEVARSIAEATEAWLRRDCDAGTRVDARTAGWSARARDVELSVYELIATQQPMAIDLRQLVSLVRLTEAVSRSGDLVAHVARSACFERNRDAFSPALRSLVVEMATVAASQFGDALNAFAAEDGEASQRVESSDHDLDLLHHELLATLLTGVVDGARHRPRPAGPVLRAAGRPRGGDCPSHQLRVDRRAALRRGGEQHERAMNAEPIGTGLSRGCGRRPQAL